MLLNVMPANEKNVKSKMSVILTTKSRQIIIFWQSKTFFTSKFDYFLVTISKKAIIRVDVHQATFITSLKIPPFITQKIYQNDQLHPGFCGPYGKKPDEKQKSSKDIPKITSAPCSQDVDTMNNFLHFFRVSYSLIG